VSDFRRVREADVFIGDIFKLLRVIQKGHVLSLMCAEKDPFDCHRFALVSYELEKNNINVNHILESGLLISSNDMEEKLLIGKKICLGRL